ncbi:winged helix-turn-helix transcriptional regulator [Duganella sp. Dugasp56]|uniref:winged helix-turn-helix transcriptional regulator n=1 Tax=Duganella sp. Dugasp56 TaxID=3243046 RepID=UPI0039B02D7D
MLKTDLSAMACPIARSLDKVGEWWSILILRECSYGETRFDAFQKNLGISPNMLARRLNDLVDAGLLERRRYSERPPRDEYVLTEAGCDFRPVLLALLAWGNKHFAPEGKMIVLRDRISGEEVQPTLMDPATGAVIDRARHAVAAGPAAPESTRLRMQRMAERRAAAEAAA